MSYSTCYPSSMRKSWVFVYPDWGSKQDKKPQLKIAENRKRDDGKSKMSTKKIKII